MDSRLRVDTRAQNLLCTRRPWCRVSCHFVVLRAASGCDEFIRTITIMFHSRSSEETRTHSRLVLESKNMGFVCVNIAQKA